MTGSQTAAVRCTHGGDCPIHPDAQGLHNYSAEWDRGGILDGPWEVYVDTIRTAAQLMRERAAKATPGPYQSAPYGGVVAAPTAEFPEHDGYGGHLIGESMSPNNRDHVVGWHPAVALAVADWLDTGANQYACVDRAPMLRVARAYLGETPAPVAVSQ